MRAEESIRKNEESEETGEVGRTIFNIGLARISSLFGYNEYRH